MTQKHTQGTWIDKGEDNKTGYRFIVAYDGKRICNLSLQLNNAETDTNAALIAAAPDLKQELEKSTEYLERIFESFKALDDCHGSPLHKQIQASRAALAKAEGGAE